MNSIISKIERFVKRKFAEIGCFAKIGILASGDFPLDFTSRV